MVMFVICDHVCFVTCVIRHVNCTNFVSYEYELITAFWVSGGQYKTELNKRPN